MEHSTTVKAPVLLLFYPHLEDPTTAKVYLTSKAGKVRSAILHQQHKVAYQVADPTVPDISDQ
jgi:hypothetical protein